MPREDGLATGVRTRFSTSYQPPNRGRKPSKLRAWIKENNVSNDDFISIFKTIIATHTLEELEDMVSEKKKKKLPIIVALCISAFLHDMKTGTLNSTNTILDRIMGKPTQQISIGGGGENELPTDHRERKALADRLRKEILQKHIGTDTEGKKTTSKPRTAKTKGDK